MAELPEDDFAGAYPIQSSHGNTGSESEAYGNGKDAPWSLSEGEPWS
jgi:hypothetical protein